MVEVTGSRCSLSVLALISTRGHKLGQVALTFIAGLGVGDGNRNVTGYLITRQ